MKPLDQYLKVRYAVQIEGISKRAAARRFGVDPRTVDKMPEFSAPPGYRRTKPASTVRCGGSSSTIRKPASDWCSSPTIVPTTPTPSPSSTNVVGRWPARARQHPQDHEPRRSRGGVRLAADVHQPDSLVAAAPARLEALFLPCPRGRVHRQGGSWQSIHARCWSSAIGSQTAQNYGSFVALAGAFILIKSVHTA
jgi:hypothetical protein